MLIKVNQVPKLDSKCFPWRSAQLVRVQSKQQFICPPIQGQIILVFRLQLIGLKAGQLVFFTHLLPLIWVVPSPVVKLWAPR